MDTHPGGERRSGLALLTDLYQLTMAYGYWRLGRADEEAVFHLFFRQAPFHGSFALACGLADAVDFLRQFRYSADDLGYLATLTGRDCKPLFSADFLRELGRMRLTCDVDALPEGTPVFPHEPLVRVRGPLWQAQLLETPLLTLLNFPTLIATKAARICRAARGEPVLEFGLRRAQGADGGITASRAAYIGGCEATSNVLAGRSFGIPVRGTHAHSWVMSFDDEAAAFHAYAEVQPNNSIFLVDTYDTLAGVRQAIDVGRAMQQRGHEMIGIRLDSGDLTELSIAARRLLDAAGFSAAAIVATSDLDEYQIEEMKRRGAKVNVWGVGTRLATSFDQPALGGVYKLAALRRPGEPWRYRVKLSERREKSSHAGIQQIRRYWQNGAMVGDLLYDEPTGTDDGGRSPEGIGLADGLRWTPPAEATHRDLLAPIFRGGALAYSPPSATVARDFAQTQLAALPERFHALREGPRYPVALEARLWNREQALRRDLAAPADG